MFILTAVTDFLRRQFVVLDNEQCSVSFGIIIYKINFVYIIFLYIEAHVTLSAMQGM
jgi:hypothetical protein